MKYNVEFLKVSDVKPYEKNAKKHDDAQVEQIAKSIEQFGFRQNIVIDKDNVVIIGHGRLLAAQKLGLDVVPCVRATDLTKKQIQALRIADNKIHESSFWDNEMLAEELKDIGEDIKMTDFGFGDFELQILTGDYEPEPFDDGDFEEYKEASENTLKEKRVIINFSDEQEADVRKLLGIKDGESMKIVYKFEELNKK